MEAQTPEISTTKLKVLIYRIEPKKHSWGWSGLLLDPDERGKLRPQIRIQCIHCLDETVFGRNKCTIVIDPKPRWTKTDPHKYIERYLLCGNCNTHRRLIPVDNDIPTLSESRISKLYKSTSHLSQETQLQRLGALRPASKVHRFQRVANRFPSKKEQPRYVKAVWEIAAYDPKRSQIEVQCSSFGGKGPGNKYPLWQKETGEYLALRFFGCRSKECYLHRRHWIPQDKTIPYVYQRTLEEKLKLHIA